ncbi:MAG: DNA replication and repair protein RecF [Patescibacteria group bacterium]
MILKSIHLQNFRNYRKQEFTFSANTTLIVGPNTAGKTNLIEAIFFLSTGKSFKGADRDVISFGCDIARIRGNSLEIIFAWKEERFMKRYLVNGVAKQRVNFVGNLPAVLFAPSDLELVTASPGIRRNYLDFVLEQSSSNYRRALLLYEKGLRSRNKLLENAKKLGRKIDAQFEYWDNTLIINGNTLTRTREKFLEFVNESIKDIFDFKAVYEPSIISKERLLQYKDAELASGVTLVGPHRDDFRIEMKEKKSYYDMKTFGSRGQQRLAILQLKIIELSFLKEVLEETSLLLLDDILSELDEEHIDLVLENTLLRPIRQAQSYGGQRQTIITTTHREFIPKSQLKDMNVIELPRTSNNGTI